MLQNSQFRSFKIITETGLKYSVTLSPQSQKWQHLMQLSKNFEKICTYFKPIRLHNQQPNDSIIVNLQGKGTPNHQKNFYEMKNKIGTISQYQALALFGSISHWFFMKAVKAWLLKHQHFQPNQTLRSIDNYMATVTMRSKHIVWKQYLS